MFGDKRIPHRDSLAKYAVAFFRMSRSSVTRSRSRFNRLGEIRDRSFEQQRYRASGLNLVTAAIVLWNTVYLGFGEQWNSEPT